MLANFHKYSVKVAKRFKKIVIKKIVIKKIVIIEKKYIN